MTISTHRCVIALGSNLGHRLNNLVQARSHLEERGHRCLFSGGVYESEPIGAADQLFYNSALLIETSLSPEDLLRDLKQIEASLGRSFTAPRWSNRPIDLDIITYDNKVITTEHLHIPHKEYSRRLFVLLPMKDVVPEWVDPTTGLTLHSLIQRLPSNPPTLVLTHW